MKEFNYVIIGGGCSGLSLAYELEIHKKLENKTLAIVEPRNEYKRDKTWSFWKVISHNFDDCVKKSWNNFSVKTAQNSKNVKCNEFPYQTIDSKLFYEKIITRLQRNKNIVFFKDVKDLNTNNSFIFNSIPSFKNDQDNLWQHFYGVEVETHGSFFDDSTINLMDFNCEQRNSVHFFYTLPFEKNRALIETTWLSKINDSSLKDYNNQIKDYINNRLGIKDYKVTYSEEGSIPLFYPSNRKEKNKINIGTAGGMTRLSTGYTFLNIQLQSQYLRENIDKIENSKIFEIKKKYKFLDKIFLRVLETYPKRMPDIFLRMFSGPANTVIKFLSNKSNIIEDISIVLKMPKWIFIRAIFGK
tara:strand:- start:1812 stop:2882 length:1071 start_codon:yes stop_codon:yes gene_type:complete